MQFNAYANAAAGMTWNPADKAGNVTLSNGNLTLTADNTGSAYRGARATRSVSSGKIYVEAKLTAAPTVDLSFGLLNGASSLTSDVNTASGELRVWGNFSGTLRASFEGSSIDTGIAGAVNDVYGWAIDFTAGKAWLRINGTWYNSGDPAAGTNPTRTGTFSTTVYPFCQLNGDGNALLLLPDSGSWVYSAPSGFSAIP